MSRPRRLALVDANSFYCSAERLMRPDLQTTPVVVLSNNDGMPISRTAEAKALGIAMGEPWFKIREKAERAGVVAFSSNYTLYADLSRRFMSVLGQFVAPGEQEIYSIDESFLDFSAHPIADLTDHGRQIKARVAQWVGLPVCVGFGSTKTLAKLANNAAKKQPRFGGVCDLTALSALDLDRLMQTVEVKDVWGIGRKLSAKLIDMGIHTAAQLKHAEPKRLRQCFGVVVERTVAELNGESVLEWEDQPPARQQIIASRSFGSPICDLNNLAEAVRSHMGRAAEKLRCQGSVAGMVSVWIETNRFRVHDAQYSPQRSIPLPQTTDDTANLTAWAIAGLKSIYKPSYRYVKAGVMLQDLRPKGTEQRGLFDTPAVVDDRRERLMGVLDKANAKWGRGTMGIGQAGGRKTSRDWDMLRDKLSPAYTTDWHQLRVVT